MNNNMWPPKDMLNAVLLISPAPYFSDGWKTSNWLVGVLWRVTSISDGMMIVETLAEHLV